MGKIDEQQLPVQQQREADVAGGSTCTVGISRIFRQFSFKCVAVLLLSFAVFVSALFWVLPRHSNKQYGFDAKESIKLSASVQSYFRLQKPASDLIPHIARLEYDINGEIGVPHSKVAVLSMHQAGVSNWTDVVFGFLSDPLNSEFDPVSLSVLKSSLIDLFLRQSNLTLTNSTFGPPSSFEILKFPGGITLIPKQSRSVWQIPQILFNFTLNNSISEINEYYVELTEQLKLGLHLSEYEHVHVQVTNKNGSSRDPPVIVEASITSDFGNLPPQRLKQLAQIITGSPSGKNLGLNNSVFGKVKEVRLSSYLNHSIHAAPPSPSPAPSPVQDDYVGPSLSPLPAYSPSYSPSTSPSFPYSPPCVNCDSYAPSDGTQPPYPESKPPHSSPPISNSPRPPTAHCVSQLPPSPSPTLHAIHLPSQPSNHPPSNGPTSQISPGPSPLPVVSYGSRRGPEKQNGAPPPVSPSISPFSSSCSFCKETWWFCLFGVLMSHLLCWTF